MTSRFISNLCVCRAFVVTHIAKCCDPSVEPPFAKPRQHFKTHWGRDKMDAISQTTLSNAFSWMKISIKISLKFVPKGPINEITALFQRMAWRRPGDKPFSEPMMVNLPTQICVSRPQWVKGPCIFKDSDITVTRLLHYTTAKLK